MSTSLYFVVNDAFYGKALPKSHLPEGVIFGSLKDMAKKMGVSYPTVRNYLDDLIEKLNNMEENER